jgi:UDP-N-acetylglucosamine--N-acetylmuramyl-(pentapeptide) pyrophosphoryl-undecaprenol N-acetylglucosamine transferase
VRALFVCGGTGGHVFPAMAIAGELQKQNPGVEVCFAGRADSLEYRLVKDTFDFRPVPAFPLQRKPLWKNLALPLKLIQSVKIALNVVDELKPTLVVATGGYVSVPVLFAALVRKVPLFLQEQNSVMGIANKLFYPFCSRLYTGFTQPNKSTKKIRDFGNPIRPMITQSTALNAIDQKLKGRKLVLVMGGSQGAAGINRFVGEVIPWIQEQQDIYVVWQVGARNEQTLQAKYGDCCEHLEVHGFLNGVYDWMAKATVIVSRAGASSIAEILAMEVPVILVPFPYATANHQEHNARGLESAGAARFLLESQPNIIRPLLAEILGSESLRTQMKQAQKKLARTSAAQMIVKDMLEVCNDSQ